MKIEYGLNFAQYKAAQWLYLKKHKWSMASYIIWIWMLPALGLVSGVYTAAVWLIGDHIDATRLLKIFLPFIVFTLAMPLCRIWKLRSSYAEMFKRNPSRIVTLDWDDEQLISAIPGKSEGRFYWSALESLAEDQRIVLIFVSAKKFLMVPREALSQDAIAALRRRIGKTPAVQS